MKKFPIIFQHDSMQKIKLQDCEERRRWEWENTQKARIPTASQS